MRKRIFSKLAAFTILLKIRIKMFKFFRVYEILGVLNAEFRNQESRIVGCMYELL